MAVRLGLVGCGRWGGNILRDLRALDVDVDVVARTPESMARASEGGAGRIVEAVGELEDVEGTVVATPTSTHAEVVEAVLEATTGPVFVEKPLTDDPMSARRIAQTAPDRVFVMDKWRYHPGVEAIAEVRRSGVLGSVHGLRTVRLQWGSAHRDVDPVWILAPHDLSIALEIMGHVPSPIAASGESLQGQLVGLVAILEGGVTLEVSAAAPAFRREVRLICEDGVALLSDPYADHIELRRPGEEEGERHPISTELPLLRELRAFVEHVRGGPPPRSSAYEGAEVVDGVVELHRLAANSETG